MSNYSTLYWLTRLDSAHGWLTAMIVLSAICILVYWITYFVNNDTMWDEQDAVDYQKKYKKYPIIGFWASIVCSLIMTFLPTKNEIIFIYAGGKTMDFAQKDSSLSKIPYQTTQLITEYLDKQIEEAKK